MTQQRQFENGLPLLVRTFFGLDREANSDFVGAIENLKQVAAGQATELAPSAGPRHQFDATVAGAALGTGDVGLPHGRKSNITIPVVYRVAAFCRAACAKRG